MNPPTRPASPEPVTPAHSDEEALLREVIRVSRNVLGLTLGMLFGSGLFLATNILVLKGGPHVGANLQLLDQFFPGYAVTFGGSFLGLLYGFAVGYVSGWIIGTVYNWVVLLRRPDRLQ
jgi:Ca2+-binding RTX toxin-like protein